MTNDNIFRDHKDMWGTLEPLGTMDHQYVCEVLL